MVDVAHGERCWRAVVSAGGVVVVPAVILHVPVVGEWQHRDKLLAPVRRQAVEPQQVAEVGLGPTFGWSISVTRRTQDSARPK